MNRSVSRWMIALVLAFVANTNAFALDCSASQVDCTEWTYGPWHYVWAPPSRTEFDVCGQIVPNSFSSLGAAVATMKAWNECANQSPQPNSTTQAFEFDFRDVWAPDFIGEWNWHLEGAIVDVPGSEPNMPPPWKISKWGGQFVMRDSALGTLQQWTWVNGNLTFYSSDLYTDRLRADRTYTCPAGYSSEIDDNSNQFVCYRTSPFRSDLNVGLCCDGVGNPINPGTGSKVESAFDGSVGNGFPIELRRVYDSKYVDIPGFESWPDTAAGARWRWMFISSLRISKTSSGSSIVAIRPDGKKIRFHAPVGSSTWTTQAGITDRVNELHDGTGALTGYQYLVSADRTTETYDASGILLKVEDSQAHLHAYSYDALGRLTLIQDQNGRFVKLEYLANFNGTAGIEGDQTATAGTRTDTIGRVTDSGGSVWTYSYDLNSKALTQVTYPDGTATRYHYENLSDALLLTGISDVTAGGVATRFSTYGYDAQGRAISSEHAGAAGRIDVTYLANLQTRVSEVINSATSTVNQRTYTFAALNGMLKVQSLDVACPGCGITKSRTFDSNGFSDIATDFGGNVTDTNYDSSGLLTQVIRAKGTTQSQTETRVWDTSLRVPTQIDVAGQRQKFAYNARGQVTASCTIDASNPSALTYVCGSAANAPVGVRQTRLTYCEQVDVTAGTCPLVGLIISVDGPRTDAADVAAYTYYASDEGTCAAAPTTCPYRMGDLWKITNSVGQVTQSTRYDGAGRVLSATSSAGVVTDLVYNARGWLTARKVRGADNGTEADDAITTIEYGSAGQITKVTQPDGSFLRFTYDAARRLTDVTDVLGSSIHYTLDNADHRTKVDTKDSGGTIKRTASTVYNTLGQLSKSLNAAAKSTLYTYDANGNADLTSDPINHTSDQNVDALNRLAQVVQDVGGIAAKTQFQYDARDHVTALIDPKNLTTSYNYNGLDDLTSLVSPDTGTATFGYDSAGNRNLQTDARGIATGYQYDALNRLTAVTYPTASLNVDYTYDTSLAACASNETFAAGQITQMTDASGSTGWCYDRFGNPTRKVQTISAGPSLAVLDSYNSAGQLTGRIYPDGASVTYLRNGNGQIVGVDAKPTAGAAQVSLVTSVAYLPFGPIGTLTFANGRVQTRAYDQDYGIDRVSDNATGQDEDYTLDEVGNVTGLIERLNSTTTATRAFAYDGLDRLTSNTISKKTSVESFTYDATGNRLSKKVGSASAQTYTYLSTNHRLASVAGVARSYDGSGNTISIGTTGSGDAFAYDDRGRLTQYRFANLLKDSYQYNGRSERVAKLDAVNPANNVYFMYDNGGRLLGEYTFSGTPLKQYVWLDDLLIAVLSSHDGTTHQYVLADAVGSPRVVVKPNNNAIIWRWDQSQSAFGENAPNQDVDANGVAYTLNFRLPGQYFDAESGRNNNHLRDYDSAVGRYMESDPIGLAGGINTFGYAGARPINAIDLLGLWSTEAHNEIIDRAFPDMPEMWRNYIKAGSLATDNYAMGNQGPDLAYMHAMSSSTLNKEQACRKMKEFVSDNLRAARQKLAERKNLPPNLALLWTAYAYQDFGWAMHALMDSTSPAHRGFQRWSYSEASRHGNMWDSEESLEQLNLHPDAGNQAIMLIRSAFEDPNFSYNCDCDQWK